MTPATRGNFLRIAATTALVLCDRDNLSPLKEFRDIGSRVLSSVAKTGFVRDVLTATTVAATATTSPSSRYHTTPPTAHYASAKIPQRQKEATIDSTAITTWLYQVRVILK